MSDHTVPTVRLNNGVEMPQVGFGVYQIPDDETERAVSAALEAGYRHIDTAALYGNERGVGRAVAASGIPREELFITTKLWNDDQGSSTAVPAFERSLEQLGLEHVDLYLIHWPQPARAKYIDTWLALQDGPYQDGRVRALGVSNFQPTHLRRLFLASEVRAAVNQVELHPWLAQGDLRAFDAEHQVVTEAWSPIGQGKGVLEEPAVVAVAQRHGVTPAQAVLRWHLQLGNVVIPKSATPERIVSNLDLFGFELSAGDMAEISGLDSGRRLGPDPDRFG
jgi:2,5-diketo-D-gluconate reductase A